MKLFNCTKVSIFEEQRYAETEHKVVPLKKIEQYLKDFAVGEEIEIKRIK
tara:strand:- start:1770 stop:1919 length:150 start_codon:yes stop_codon:yes gene_type:complete